MHVSPPSQLPQFTCCAQSFVDALQRLVHQFGSGEQHVWFDRQTPPSPQLDGQVIVCPQLFIAAMPHLPTHGVALSGVQQVSVARQISVVDAQLTLPAVPQATLCPQLFVTEPHVRPAHVVLIASGVQLHAFAVHEAPPSQPPHVIGRSQLSTACPQRWSQKLASVTQAAS